MSQPRFQITLGQLVKFVVLCAFHMVWLRSSMWPTVLALTAVVILGFLLDRWKGGDGVIGGTVVGGLVSGSYGLVHLAIRWLFPNPQDDNSGFLLIVPLSFVAGVVWGIVVSTALNFIIARPSHADLPAENQPRATGATGTLP